MDALLATRFFRIAKRPWWTKRRESCPVCGMPHGEEEIYLMERRHQFKCKRCGEEMSMVDFWKYHEDKTSKAMGGEEDFSI